MECLFCKIINKEIKSNLLYEDNDLIAFLDIDPQSPIHFLIVPKKHIETILDLRDENIELIGKIHILAKELAIKQGIDKNGFRMVLNCKEDGGQAVFHLHFHILGGRRMGWPPG